MKRLKIPISTLITCVFASVTLTSCFFDKKVSYDVEADKKTGVIYNQEWDEFYDKNNAYYNKTTGLLNVRSGPGFDYRVIAYMKPREGGFIRNCNFDLKWCLIDFGGKPESGWVDMRFVAEGEIEYKP